MVFTLFRICWLAMFVSFAIKHLYLKYYQAKLDQRPDLGVHGLRSCYYFGVLVLQLENAVFACIILQTI